MSHWIPPNDAHKATGPAHAEDSQPNEQIIKRVWGHNPPLVRIAGPTNHMSSGDRGVKETSGGFERSFHGYRKAGHPAQPAGLFGRRSETSHPVGGPSTSRLPDADRFKDVVPHINFENIAISNHKVSSP